MNNRNLFSEDLDDLDDYINTFKLKNFDDSDQDEVKEEPNQLIKKIQNKNFNTLEESNKSNKEIVVENNPIQKESQIELEKNVNMIPSEIKSKENLLFDEVFQMKDEEEISQNNNLKKSERSIFDVDSYDDNHLNNISKKNSNEKFNKKEEVQSLDRNNPLTFDVKKNTTISKIEVKVFEKKVRVDPFSKIYDNFENVFNKKVEIPSKNFFEREMKKLENEIDDYQSAEGLKNNEKESDIKIPEEEVIYTKDEENQFIKELLNEPEPEITSEIKIINQVEIKNQPSELETFKKEVEENEDNRFTDKQSNAFYSDLEKLDTKRKEFVASIEVEQELHKNIYFKGYFDKSNFLIFPSPKSSKNEISILDLKIQIQNINTYVDKEYFPISYSQKFDSEKFKNIFSTLKSKIIKKEIKNIKIEDFVMISLLNNFLAGNMKSSILTDVESRKDLIKNIKSLKLINQSKQKESKNFPYEFFLDTKDKLNANLNFQDVLDNGIERILSECYKGKNIKNFIILSVFGKQEDIFNYLLGIFKENHEYKKDFFYILFMIRSGNITQLIEEQKDFLFQNFYNLFCLLIENLEFFYDMNILFLYEKMLKTDSIYKTFDKIIILRLITNNFNLDDFQQYADSLTFYLNFCDSFRLIICDLINYLFFNKVSQSEKFKFSVVGYCSILIKYKFLLLKIQSNSLNENLREYGEKIVQNIKQFGKYSGNNYFFSYLKDLFTIDLCRKVDNSFIKKEISKEITHTKTDHLKETQNSDYNKNKDQSNNKKQENVGGITSFLVSALGFGTSTNKQEEKKDEENKKEEEIVPEIFYDPVKKRWVLKGKIYDDEEDEKDLNKNSKISSSESTVTNQNASVFDNNGIGYTSQSQGIPTLAPIKPTLLPPKVKLNRPLTNIEPSQIKAPPSIVNPPIIKKDNLISQISNATTINPNQSHVNKQNVISNPFLTKKETVNPTNSTVTTVKVPPKINIANRYASMLDHSK